MKYSITCSASDYWTCITSTFFFPFAKALSDIDSHQIQENLEQILLDREDFTTMYAQNKSSIVFVYATKFLVKRKLTGFVDQLTQSYELHKFNNKLQTIR